jgi:Transposase
VDIGKRDCKACIMSSDGSIAEETKYNNTLHEAEIFAYSIVKKYGKCIAVCESTANLWLKTYQAFEKYNIGVKLANPLKTKAIAEAKIKTDTLPYEISTYLPVLQELMFSYCCCCCCFRLILILFPSSYIFFEPSHYS